jgi:hypothetical protein
VINRSNWNSYFFPRLKSKPFIKPYKLKELEEGRHIYQHDIDDALTDHCIVVQINSRKDKPLPDGTMPEGQKFYLYCSLSDGRVVKMVVRLYDSGDCQIITVITDIDDYDWEYYENELEVLGYA